jgi:AAA ATPase domain
VPVKGVDEPIDVFELVGASAIRQRLQAAVARGLTRFVGRQTELAALHQALAQASAGQGQVVAAVGEAGVGKSRLVYEVVHSHRLQGWRVLESASVSYGKATPYFPVLDLLKRYTHVEDRDETRTIRAKVTGQVLTLDEALQETVPALLCCWTPCRRSTRFSASTHRCAAVAPWRRSSACSCVKARWASIMASATLCFSRWAQRHGRQFH